MGGNVLTKRQQELVESLLPSILEDKQRQIDEAERHVVKARAHLKELIQLYHKVAGRPRPLSTGGGS